MAAASEHGPLPRLLIGLTVVTGLVDTFSYLTLGRQVCAAVAGNRVAPCLCDRRVLRRPVTRSAAWR